MSFQNQVNLQNAVGVPGAYAAINPVVTHPAGMVAADDLPIGVFCWPDAEEGKVTNAGAGKPLGFVVRETNYVIINIRAQAQEFIPKNNNVSVALKGDFYVATSTAATVGQKVFASLTDGSSATDEAGTDLTGYVETDYFVVTSGDVDDVILISNWIA